MNEARKREIAGAYTRAAPGYVENPAFHRFGRRLAELAGIQPGARVLDVACGRGAVLFPAAELAGPGGQVVGIDLSEGMVGATAAEVERRGLRHVAVRLMDAENLALPDASFDRVLGGVGIFFLPDPRRGLAEFRRVLAPGGRVALSTWGEGDPRWQWRFDLIRKYRPPEPAQDDSPEPAPDFHTPEGLRAFVTAGGFEDPRVLSDETELFFPSPEAWWASQWTHGSRMILEKIEAFGGPAALERFRAEAFAHLATIREPRGYPSREVALFTLATRP